MLTHTCETGPKFDWNNRIGRYTCSACIWNIKANLEAYRRMLEILWAAVIAEVANPVAPVK